jgi:hypothetical protein
MTETSVSPQTKIYISQASRHVLRGGKLRPEYEFEKGRLELHTAEEIADFEALLEGQSEAGKRMITIVSREAANKLVAAHRAQAINGPFNSENAPMKQVNELRVKEDAQRAQNPPGSQPLKAGNLQTPDDNIQTTEEVKVDEVKQPPKTGLAALVGGAKK